MNTQIIITPAGVLWVAGAIVSISAASGVLIRIYKHFRKPGETQDHRIAELERKAVNDYNRLNYMDTGIRQNTPQNGTECPLTVLLFKEV